MSSNAMCEGQQPAIIKGEGLAYLSPVAEYSLPHADVSDKCMFLHAWSTSMAAAILQLTLPLHWQ